MPRSRSRCLAVVSAPLLVGIAALRALSPCDAGARDPAPAAAAQRALPAAWTGLPDPGAAAFFSEIPLLAPALREAPPLREALAAEHGGASDAHEMVPVPEPSTRWMLGLGLAGLAVCGRRRARPGA